MAKINWQDQSQAQNQPQEPSTLQSIGGAIARPLAYLGETLGGIPGSLVRAIGNASNESETAAKKLLGAPETQEETQNKELPGLSKYIAKVLPTSEDLHKSNTKVLEHYFGKGANEAKSVPAKIANAMIVTVPIAWATGGVGAAGVEAGRTTAGSLLSQGAEAAGGGPILQTVADIIGRTGFDLGRVVTNSGNINKQAQLLKRESYAKAEALGKGKKVLGKTTADIINKDLELFQKGKGGLEGAERASTIKTAKNLIDDIKLGNIDLNDALENRKSLNNAIKDLPYKSTKRQVYERWRDSINHDIIKPAQEKFPDFGKTLSIADELHMAEKVPSFLRKYFNENASLEKQMQSPLGKLLLTGGILGSKLPAAVGAAATKAAITYTGKGLMNALEPFIKSPIIKDMYRNIGVSVENGLLTGLPKQLIEFDKEARKLEKQSKEKESIKEKKAPKINWQS